MSLVALVSSAIGVRYFVTLDRAAEPSFGLVYSVVVPLLCWWDLAGWRAKGARAFLLAAAGSQLLSGFGSLLFVLQLVFAPPFLLRHYLPYVAFNVCACAFSGMLLWALIRPLGVVRT